MKNKFSFVFVYWWIFILFVFGISLMLFAEKDERESRTENRTLSGFPELSAASLFSGDFFTGIESYLSDGMFGRDSVVGVSDKILGMFSATTHQDELLFEEMEMADQIVGGGAEASDEDKAAETTDDSENSTQQDAVSNDVDDEKKEEFAVSDQIDGYGFWLEKTNGEYVNLVTVPEDKIQLVADTLNRFKSYLPEGGNVFYTNVPRTNMALMLRDSGEYSGWYENTDQAMEKYLDDGVYYVNAPAMLEDGLLAGEDLYFTSDHHWNPRGALCVVNECLRLQGTPSLSYDEYEYKINRFVNEARKTNDDLPLLYPLQQVDAYDMEGADRGKRAEIIYYYMDNTDVYIVVTHLNGVSGSKSYERLGQILEGK